MFKNLPLLILLALTMVLLPACAPQAAAVAGPQAWIDTPLDGFVLPLGPVDVMSHAADPGGLTQFELSANDALVSTDPSPDSSSALAILHQTWTPAAPGDYVLKVRAMNNAGAWSDYALVHVTVIGPMPTPSGGQTSGTIGSSSICRNGPSLDYPVVLYLSQGQVVILTGRNQDGTWYQVLRPDGNGFCWVSGRLVIPDGDTGNLPPVTVEPPYVPPNETPTATGCLVFDVQQNPVCTLPCPPNAVPGTACQP